MTVMDWRLRGACRDKSPSLFFPDRANDPSIPRAKKVCNNCEVREECLEWALTNKINGDYSVGIFGGTTQDERVFIRVLMLGRSFQEFKTVAISTSVSSSNERTLSA